MDKELYSSSPNIVLFCSNLVKNPKYVFPQRGSLCIELTCKSMRNRCGSRYESTTPMLDDGDAVVSDTFILVLPYSFTIQPKVRNIKDAHWIRLSFFWNTTCIVTLIHLNSFQQVGLWLCLRHPNCLAFYKMSKISIFKKYVGPGKH